MFSTALVLGILRLVKLKTEGLWLKQYTEKTSFKVTKLKFLLILG